MAKDTSGSTGVKASWCRIDKWLKENVPDSTLSLPPGASESEIHKAEQELGIQFSDDIRESYLLHDGTNRIWISRQGYLMPLFRPKHLPKRKQALFNEVVESWTFMNEMLSTGQFADPGFKSQPIGNIRTDWWNPQWIPITYNESGDHVCLDTSPAEGGRIGQVIDWWHERGATSVLAKCFSEWLEQCANDLEHRKCRFDTDTETLVF